MSSKRLNSLTHGLVCELVEAEYRIGEGGSVRITISSVGDTPENQSLSVTIHGSIASTDTEAFLQSLRTVLFEGVKPDVKSVADISKGPTASEGPHDNGNNAHPNPHQVLAYAKEVEDALARNPYY